jgi:hypothetical protein
MKSAGLKRKRGHCSIKNFMKMTQEQTTIINKIRLLTKLRAWDTLNSKLQHYLGSSYSCYHCRFLSSRRDGVIRGSSKCNYSKITNMGNWNWCLVWTESGNWIDKSEESGEYL